MASEASGARVVGEGVYGRVEEATANGKRSVWKVFHEALLTEQAKGRLTEMKQLSYPGLLSILEVTPDPSPRLSMELMPQSLREALRGDIEGEWRSSILLDVARALDFLQGCDPPMFHGDLHTGNVLLTDSMRAKLSDYAQVYLVGRNPVQVMRERRAGHRCLLYMPPEAFSEPPAPVGPEFDVFSFGVVMLETLAEQPWEVSVTSVEFQWPTGGEQRATGLGAVPDSHPLKRVAEHCLSLKCGDRPSVEELCSSLRCGDEPVEAEEESATPAPCEGRSCSPGTGDREGRNGEEKGQENVQEERGERREDKGEGEEEEEEEGKEKQQQEEDAGQEGAEADGESGREAERRVAEEEEGRVGGGHDPGGHTEGEGGEEDFVVVSSPSPGQVPRPGLLFEHGSMVEVRGYGYGVVQWVGDIRGKKMAGVELVSCVMVFRCNCVMSLSLSPGGVQEGVWGWHPSW